MRILVTGGTGFIGSHTCVALLDAGYDVTALDNLCNSDASVIGRVGQICGREPAFVEGDIRDALLLKTLFAEQPISAVLHFAGLKAVGESVKKPQAYFENNVGGTAVLLSAMQQADVKTIVFSSSATVYGEPASVPISEDFPLSATNPYGDTKLKIEDMLAARYRASPGWRIARLRYFNPVGAHQSGLIGESPAGVPDNLMPFITQAAAGLRDELSVFGDDYDTPDGTGVRDYIHVLDLAGGHVTALDYLNRNQALLTVNLGTGKGISVLEMIKTFEATNNCKVPYHITGRRPGDIAKCWADTTLANQLLGWKATHSLQDMCRDAWRWQTSLIAS
ncbi:MAG: UDP-glucose 4-epimerase GalE [Gammaproteobacteria bacterium]|nr:MAG: UDP-glucose 4-epimerase GalE [Gammaproteobacteria bacterium]